MTHYRTGEFAAKAGVTARTLRYYDRVGLLKPSERSESGQRLYSDHDFPRLQHILTLKLLGLSLNDIERLLAAEPIPIHRLLERQKAALQEKVRQLSAVIQTIESAQQSIQSSQEPDLATIISIIEAVNMNNQPDWADRFFTDDQKQHIADMSKSWTLQNQRIAGEAWKALFADIQRNMAQDVRGTAAQQLLDRWDALVEPFSQGDPQFAASVNNAYLNVSAAMPLELQGWSQELRAAAEFIQRAREARHT